MRQPELGGLLKAATNMVGIHYLSCQLSGCLAFRDSISGLLAEGMVTPEMGFLFMSFQWGFLLLPTKIVVSEWCFYSILYLLMSFYIYNYRQCLQGALPWGIVRCSMFSSRFCKRLFCILTTKYSEAMRRRWMGDYMTVIYYTTIPRSLGCLARHIVKHLMEKTYR